MHDHGSDARSRDDGGLLRLTAALIGLAATSLLSSAAYPATIPVAAGDSIQAAIDAAAPGDVVAVDCGTFVEDLDFGGKPISVVGRGPASEIRGTGTGPVVRFTSGETAASALDSFTITGGEAAQGGGILIRNGSPTIVRNRIVRNRAGVQGSGIYVEASAAAILNNLIVYNGNAGGDPHSIQIVNAAPAVINNTIARGDSNAILLSGNSPAVVMNNVLAFNGASVHGDSRGRGICDFSGGRATIAYNVFHRNRRAALLTDGIDFRRIGRAERRIGPPRLVENRDGNPGFLLRTPPRLGSSAAAEVSLDGFALRPRARARDAGNPAPAFADRDGTRNDAGFTGGPLAPDL